MFEGVPLYDTSDFPIGIIVTHPGEEAVRYWYAKNLQGDVVAIRDESGADVVRYIYDAWGNVTIPRDNSGYNLARINPFLYRGYIYDYETGLYYLQSRYYDPETGRFLNVDEPVFIGFNNRITSYNVYEYCNADPVNRVDRNGFISTAAVLSGIGTVGTSNVWNPVGWVAIGCAVFVGIIASIDSGFGSSSESVGDYTVVGSADLVLPKAEIVPPNSTTILIPEYERGSVWHRVKINKVSIELAKRKISNRIKTIDGKIDLSKFSKKPNSGPPKWIGPLGYELIKDMSEHKGKAYKLFQYGVSIATISWDGIILGK